MRVLTTIGVTVILVGMVLTVKVRFKCTQLCQFFSHFNLYWSLVDPRCATEMPPPPQQDPILLFSHMFLPKSTHIRGQCPPTAQHPPPMGNPGSTTVNGGIIGFSDYMQINSFNDFHTLNLETRKFRIKPGTNRNVMSSLVRMKMRSYHIW